MDARPQAVELAEEYYDSDAANAFYHRVWGGEDIHIGLYQTPDEDIAAASRRTVETMAKGLGNLTAQSRVIDLGAGYGGSARYLAAGYDCRVTCLNLSQAQNDINRVQSDAAGLSHLIDIRHGSFEDVPADDGAYDIVWSQDAFLHSGRRGRVMDEIGRILKPGGEVIFTDPMQADDCPGGVLQPILDRIHLETLGSFAFYRGELEKRGFDAVAVSPMLNQLRTHYSRVADVLRERYGEITGIAGQAYVDNMLKGLGHWVDGAGKGYLAWGILHFRKAG